MLLAHFEPRELRDPAAAGESFERTALTVADRAEIRTDGYAPARRRCRSFRHRASRRGSTLRRAPCRKSEKPCSAHRCRPEFPFGQRAGVRIVMNPRADTETIAQQLDDRDVVPARQIRRRHHYAGTAVGATAATDSYRGRIAGRQSVLSHHIVHCADDVGDRLVDIRSSQTGSSPGYAARNLPFCP